jgi:hypothetical protein
MWPAIHFADNLNGVFRPPESSETIQPRREASPINIHSFCAAISNRFSGSAKAFEIQRELAIASRGRGGREVAVMAFEKSSNQSL